MRDDDDERRDAASPVNDLAGAKAVAVEWWVTRSGDAIRPSVIARAGWSMIPLRRPTLFMVKK